MKPPKKRIQIDSDKCVGCRNCVNSPGSGMIRFRNDRAEVVGSGRAADPDGLAERCRGGAIQPGEIPAGEVPPPLEPIRIYVNKMRGVDRSRARENAVEIFWSWVGAFLGIGAVAFINFKLLAGADLMLMVGSFGASAVLIYGAVKSPLAQPRNLVGGHVLSALIGVASFKALAPHIWLAAPVAVATAIAVMHLTKTLHPPGGATALIAVIGSKEIHDLGFFYAVAPVGLGVLVMLAVALLINNVPSSRRYPVYWL